MSRPTDVFGSFVPRNMGIVLGFSFMINLSISFYTDSTKFGNKIMFDDSVQNQGWIEPGYDAEIPAGLVIRVHYFTKNTTNDVLVIMNMKLHEVAP